ncbi:MAG: hypothetical protein JSW12_03395, partial [Deltaproteobacteria bacterium]
MGIFFLVMPLAPTRLPDGGQAWHAKHQYKELTYEILQRPHCIPEVSRLPIPSRSRDGEGGPKNETGIVTVTHKRYSVIRGFLVTRC